MPGDFTDEEIRSMTPEQLYEAANRGWTKLTDPADAPAAQPEFAEKAPQPSGDVWRRRKADRSVFTCPSGQTVRLRAIPPEVLLTAGILDKVTRLEGLADGLVKLAEGAPPTQQKMPTREEFAILVDTVNTVVPLAVVEPEVLPDPAEGEPVENDALYVSDIDLGDRVAIMNESFKELRMLDRFRNAG